jgi:hypothetical protein
MPTVFQNKKSSDIHRSFEFVSLHTSIQFCVVYTLCLFGRFDVAPQHLLGAPQ